MDMWLVAEDGQKYMVDSSSAIVRFEYDRDIDIVDIEDEELRNAVENLVSYLYKLMK